MSRHPSYFRRTTLETYNRGFAAVGSLILSGCGGTTSDSATAVTTTITGAATEAAPAVNAAATQAADLAAGAEATARALVAAGEATANTLLGQPTATEVVNSFAAAAAEQSAVRAATRTAVVVAIGTPYDPFGDDLNCSDFTTQAQVQVVLEASGPNDPYNLDDNPKDGKACESLS